ncbi:FMN-dependent NADH-azoreductase [Flavobacterium hiemivividum]|uniref:FMN dependent NADH:quinone oxidoreductase n=1 Tax=Flavobacterium hiemivividum TaxID=2541734 RepID=A0A4R5CVI5_9FLAO|nr:NAD(P)H-dependent oxidoreductase [Flavobacterium hiemivividum]TDE03470.1 FMN-dependent NADH-azoreductase [Flavobacterium hiemivividum]
MNILYIKTSISGENSHSLKLADFIVDKHKETHKNSTVVVKDLVKSPLPYFSEEHYKLLFSNEDKNPEALEMLKKHDQSIEELENADVVVVTVPMYNFGIPAVLKTWIDFISRAKRTFKYTENGPEGLLVNKKVYLAISSGGLYTTEEMKSLDFTESFLKTVFNFLGMTDITVLRVEGVGIPGVKENAFEKAISNFQI